MTVRCLSIALSLLILWDGNYVSSIENSLESLHAAGSSKLPRYSSTRTVSNKTKHTMLYLPVSDLSDLLCVARTIHLSVATLVSYVYDSLYNVNLFDEGLQGIGLDDDWRFKKHNEKEELLLQIISLGQWSCEIDRKKSRVSMHVFLAHSGFPAILLLECLGCHSCHLRYCSRHW